MVVRYTIVGLGILLALAALGLDLAKFGLLAGALGVGLGFGLQNIVANFVSGIILAFERPIQSGDMVQFGSLWGTITSIGVRSTKVRSFDGSEVVIPNSDLISKEVTNWTLSDRLRRLDFPVKVEFGSDPRQVIDVMLTAVRSHEVPLSHPEPFVIFQGLGEYYLEFTLYFWITTDRYLAGKNEVGIAALEALKKAGIQIPSAPHRITIHDARRPGEEPDGTS
jgi:small-conductance mechanosensitive channel